MGTSNNASLTGVYIICTVRMDYQSPVHFSTFHLGEY